MALPQSMQHLFWSTHIQNLHPKTDAAYIINQTLAYGTLEDLRWLFHIYPKTVIVETFLNHPIKTYTPSALHFAALILGISPKNIRHERYDNTLPRHIGS